MNGYPGFPSDDALREYLDDEGYPQDLLLADGFSKAFVGVARIHPGPSFCVYDREWCRKVLEDQGMTDEEAEGYLSFNTLSAYVGPGTPAFIDRLTNDGS
jgi:hypothetical protein